MKRALVLGMARSGQSAADLLERRGVEVVRADRTLGNDGDTGLLDDVDVLVKSPGVPGGQLLVRVAQARGIPVWSEVELGYRLLGVELVGVTGTNGKTTTTELLGAILGAPTAGNVGRALTGIEAEAGELVVCELSSFQLEDIDTLRCRVAVLLNLEPDHLDRHGTVEAYRDAKLRIFENQGEDDTAVVPRGFPAVPGRGRRVEFHAGDPLPAEPRIPGAHNRENAAAATAAARALGVPDERIAEALATFPGVPHRLELVGQRGGVRYVNDSKATNVAAARRALAAYAGDPVHLILGGSPKGEDYTPLVAAIGPNVRGVYLIGETAAELAAALGDRPSVRAGHLAAAVSLASAAAVEGDVVLLSPACASFDQYDDFEQRGEDFRRLVANLA
ncbi:MAG TPA: Mur ligase family protein [Gaiellaceae bacterium]|nr:Mur ligase family protein [Gaiellaceae bacterium]